LTGTLVQTDQDNHKRSDRWLDPLERRAGVGNGSFARREKTLHRFDEQTGLIYERHVSALGKRDEFRPLDQRIHLSGRPAASSWPIRSLKPRGILAFIVLKTSFICFVL